MGMDLSSIKNDAYFRANIWSWRPLWNLVKNEVGLTNEEYESGSCKLSKIDLPKIIKEYNYYLDNLPLEDCDICDGNGKRNDENVKGNCNACNNEYTRKEGIPVGKRPNWQTNYKMYQEHIEEFIDFCDKSKGFRIY